MKKLFMFSAVFLCFCASVFFAASDGSGELALAPAAKAATIVDSGKCGDEGDNVTWTLDSDGLLTISGTGAMSDYSWGGYIPWKDSSVKSVVISDGVTSICDRAFDGCEGLTSVTIPDSVTSIGERTFFGCTGLMSVTIPGGVTSIGEEAFYNCVSITTLIIPDSVVSLGEYAVNNVANVSCSDSKIVYAKGARTINGYIEDGLVYDDSNKNILSACPASRSGTLKIPGSVTEIGYCAFYFCDKLTDITVPDSVMNIGDCAFVGCYSLKNINIPDGITVINYAVFSGCGFTKIDLPDSVTLIGSAAFSGCRNLVSINIPDGAIGIGGFSTFQDCSSLRSITIPAGVDSIGDGTFSGCGELSITVKNENLVFNNDRWLGTLNDAATVYGHAGGKLQECAEKYNVKFVPIHMWDNGTVTREPQVGVAGERTFTCTVCSATRTEEISPLVPSAPDRIEVKSSDSAKELNDGIVGATHSVTVSELLASSNASFIVDKDGNRVTDTKPLATGMKIILESGGERLEKVISVLGDVNGDGEISVSDARGALRAAVGLDTLEGAYLNAARVNGANEVAVSDARSILRAAVALDTGKDWLANIK